MFVGPLVGSDIWLGLVELAGLGWRFGWVRD